MSVYYIVKLSFSDNCSVMCLCTNYSVVEFLTMAKLSKPNCATLRMFINVYNIILYYFVIQLPIELCVL